MTTSHPDFEGCDGDSGGGGAPGIPTALRTNVVPLGTINGVNTVFAAPDNFTHDGITNEAVYLRGKRVREGAGTATGRLHEFEHDVRAESAYHVVGGLGGSGN